MPPQVKIVALLTAKPDRAEELETLLRDMAPLCRSEEGNLRWDVWRDQAQPNLYVLDELYAGEASVASHRQTSHYQHYLSRIPDIADRTALVLNPLALAPASGARDEEMDQL